MQTNSQMLQILITPKDFLFSSIFDSVARIIFFKNQTWLYHSHIQNLLCFPNAHRINFKLSYEVPATSPTLTAYCMTSLPGTWWSSPITGLLAITYFSSVQSLSRVWLFATPWTAAQQASLSINNSRSLIKLMSIKSVTPSSHLILCRPLLLLLSIFPIIRVFSNKSSVHIRWLKDWSFSFNISPSNEHSGLISFRMDGLDLLAVQGSLKSLLQHHSSKASILQSSAFFMVQFSHPYMTTGKTTALPRRTFVGKVMSLPFNMLSRFVITFLPRSKHLLISWPQSPSTVILEPKKIKVSHYFHCFSFYLPWSDGTRCHDLFSECWALSQLFSLSSFTFIKRLFSSSLSAIRVVSSAYLRLLIFLPAILIPDCASSSPAFLMMYSAYKLSKQGDNIQPWRTPFPIWNQSVVPCPVLTVAY